MEKKYNLIITGVIINYYNQLGVKTYFCVKNAVYLYLMWLNNCTRKREDIYIIRMLYVCQILYSRVFSFFLELGTVSSQYA